MEIFTFIYEVLFLFAGIYLFLFSIGKLKIKDATKKQKIEEFRKSINPMAIIFSILLIFFYGASLAIHIYQYFD